MESSSSSNTLFEDNTENILNLSRAPEKDPEIQSDQTSKFELRKPEPEWLERFIKRTFFYPCSQHSIWRNELNKYCIDCDTTLCHYCLLVVPHLGHRLLKLYRHAHKDVTPLDVIGQLIDCTQIQPYRCNKQLVIALTPLPHTRSKTSNDEELCQTCKRKLIEHHVHSYCSIACKVEAFTKKEGDDSPPFLSLNLEQTNTAVDQPVQNAIPDPGHNKRKRKRKGIPRRAPFF